ncbi:hypothetical protein [Cryptosporangium sp. NPDC051539]|uniref:hypothetical protein n=1 Tax=Cryptosporangium sp. NPDC051539 TaxID=3363962 RepID=UPI00379ED2E4
MAEHVRVHPWHPDPGGRREVFEPAGCCVPVHPVVTSVAQDRSGGSFVGGAVELSPDGGWEWNEDDLASFASDSQDTVAPLSEIGDVGSGRFEDP